MNKLISILALMLLAVVVDAQPSRGGFALSLASLEVSLADAVNHAAQSRESGKNSKPDKQSKPSKNSKPDRPDKQQGKKQKAKLWAILVADTEDRYIGADDQLDNKRLNSELNDIAKALGIECKIVNITGENAYRKTKLAKTIDNLKPSPNDIVFFCFNGHGFRWDDQKDQYPMVYLYNGRDEFTNQYVAASDIYDAIVAKGARLNIVITDCCNAEVGSFRPSQQGSTLYSRPTTPVSIDRLKALFLQAKGNTLVASAKPGEYSYSFSNYGSAFTQAFLRAIHTETSSDQTGDVSWVRIIDSSIRAAREKTTSCESTQHGIRFTTVKAVK